LHSLEPNQAHPACCPSLHWPSHPNSEGMSLTDVYHVGGWDNRNHKKKTPWSESTSELYRPSDRRLSAKWLPTFADRGCHVVSVTDPYGRILGFSRQEPLLFLPSSSSIVLTRLSGPR
jgi:hypothetical protein